MFIMNPYIIGPYKESDSSKFLGRTAEIKEMYKNFMQNDYLVCYANSGEGKSSILNAGLFPQLRKNKYFPINIRFNFDNEINTVSDFDKIINDIIDESLNNRNNISYIIKSTLYETDDCESTSLQNELILKYVWLRLRYSELIINDEKGNTITYTPVLVFDQFEEVFTNPRNEIWTLNFFKWLEELSTDTCPQRILNEIENFSKDEFILISSFKKFKAIFSLRSEYVGNIDYWGLQHYYIPDLKNNRFFLKPLTPEGAKEVIMQNDGIHNISEEICNNLIKGCSGNNEYVEAGMPCVPASMLSIICHELYNLNNFDRNSLIKQLNIEQNTTVENVLEKYYLKTLYKCGIKDDKTRDTLENALVDDRGNRKRVITTDKSLSKIPKKTIDKLISINILRVVSTNSENIEHVIELPHDRFCHFIMNHKNKRFNEIQKKNKRLKEWIIFGILAIVFSLTALKTHEIFASCTLEYVDFLTKNNINDIIKNFNFFINNTTSLKIVCIITLLYLISYLILCFTNQKKKYTIILSTCGIITYLLLNLTINIVDEYVQNLALLLLLASIIAIIYTIARWKNNTNYKISEWPIVGSLIIFISIIWIKFLNSAEVELNLYNRTYYFPLLISIILIIWTLLFFNAKNTKNKGWSYGISLNSVILLYVYCIPKNNLLFSIIILGVFLISLSYYLLNNIPKQNKLSAITINIVATIVIFAFYLGYNPIALNHKSISQVHNWKIAIVENPKTKLLGICDAISGDTIMPCRFVSHQKRLMLKSAKFPENPIAFNGYTNLDGSFKWDNGICLAELNFRPLLEEYIREIDKKEEYIKEINDKTKDSCLQDCINYYSVQLLKEIRKVCIEYIVNAKPYEINDLNSLNILDSLQYIALKKEISTLNEGGQLRDKIDLMEDNKLQELLESITKCYYIYILKDRILKKDYTSIFAYTNVHLILYMSNIPRVIIQYRANHEINIMINDYNFKQNFTLNVLTEDIEKKRCYAWYNMFIDLCYSDISNNTKSFENSLNLFSNPNDVLDKLKEIGNLVDKQNNIIETLNDTTNTTSLNKISNKEKILSSLKEMVNKLNSVQKIENEIKEIKDSLPTIENSNDININDEKFNNYSNLVINAMLDILEKKPYNMYKGTFEDIYKHLMVARMFHNYDITLEKERMMKIDSINDKFSKLFELFDIQERNMQIKNSYNKIKNN